MVKIGLASWEDRFVAFLLDLIIFSVGFYLIIFIAKIVGFMEHQVQGFTGWYFFFSLEYCILFFLYFLVMEGIYGQSLGKMKIGIKIVQKGGGKNNIVQVAILSSVKSYPFTLFPYLLLVDLVGGHYFFPGKKLRISNKITNTVVVKTKNYFISKSK